NGFQYQCVVSGTCAPSATSAPRLLTVNKPLVIRSQPVDVAVCAGSSTTLSVAATGTTPAYQWQLSTNGGSSFSNISGATTSTLALNNLAPSSNNNLYRCLVSGATSCNAVLSSNARLQVNPIPVVTLTANPYTRLYPGMSTTLTASSTPSSVNFEWFRDGAQLTGVTGNSLSVNIDLLGLYSVKATDAIGCSARSAELLIADSASQSLFIYPNPNSGIFQVRFYNTAGHTTRSLRIFDAKGSLVYYKTYAVTAMYERVDVNISQAAAGVYFVDLHDGQGNRIARGKVLVRR
ncbi:MAG: T9SS type A sorting domain-containing protein, partial [Sphingobacteriales bacterium]